MLFSTTFEIPGRVCQSHRGLVSSEIVCTVPLFKEMFSRLKDVLGGRLYSFEGLIARSRQQALDELSRQAEHLNADALVGLSLQHQWMGRPGSVLMLCATATAISLQAESKKTDEQQSQT